MYGARDGGAGPRGRWTSWSALFRATYANGDITYLRPSTATNAESREVEAGRLDVVRRGSGATVVAVGPMLDRTTAAVEGMDATVLDVTSVAPFDADGLAREVADGPDVISATPFLEGTLDADAHVGARRPALAFTSIGVGNDVLRETGRRSITIELGAWTSAESGTGSRASSIGSGSA